VPIVEGENWRPINKKYHNSREVSLKREDPDIGSCAAGDYHEPYTLSHSLLVPRDLNQILLRVSKTFLKS